MMGINAVKGVEIGAGFRAARLRGEENADPMRPATDGSNRPDFLSNNAGGIAGGISTGQPVVVRGAVKPTTPTLRAAETRVGKECVSTLRSRGWPSTDTK